MTPKYCRNCGKELDSKMNFCVHCGVASSGQIPISKSPSQLKQKTSASKVKSVWIGIIVGLLLIGIGIRLPIVILFGEQTSARINSVQRRVNNTEDSMDYRYEIKYQFVAKEGKQTFGSYSLTNVYNQSKLPAVNSKIQIKYVPGLTFINAPISQDKLGVGSVILIALGVFLIFFGVRGNLTIGRVRRR